MKILISEKDFKKLVRGTVLSLDSVESINVNRVRNGVRKHKNVDHICGQRVEKVNIKVPTDMTDGFIVNRKKAVYDFRQGNITVYKDKIAKMVILNLDHEYKLKLLEILQLKKIEFKVVPAKLLDVWNMHLITGDELKLMLEEV